MAKFIIITVAVLAVIVSQTFAQNPNTPPQGTKPLGASCEYRAECDASKCSSTQSICCDGYKVALATKVFASGTGKCTCCNTSCGAQLAHGQSVTPNTAAHADAYHQGCTKQ